MSCHGTSQLYASLNPIEVLEGIWNPDNACDGLYNPPKPIELMAKQWNLHACGVLALSYGLFFFFLYKKKTNLNSNCEKKIAP